MLLAETFLFPSPTLNEFAFAVSLWWLSGLILIACGAYGQKRSKTELVEILATVVLMLGFGACILLEWYFTPLNRHHVFIWTDDLYTNNWIDVCLGLTILGTSLLFYWIGRKLGKLGVKHSEQNAN